MKNGFTLALAGLVVFVLVCRTDPSLGEEKEKTFAPSTSQTIKEKTNEELQTMKKDIQRTGREFKESAHEFPSLAGRELQKTDAATKEAGKGIKENLKESFEDLKKLFKK